MILNLILWYIVIAVAGWLAFPLAFRLLAYLPDRGLALSRPLGLLLSGYAWWLLTSLGLLQNGAGGAFFALLLVGGLSAWVLWKGGWQEVSAWLRRKRGMVLATELLFLALFAFIALVRAADPNASGTEKPMELAFINSILRSPTFPPADPWLSGYGISYYYFGYVMVALLARISGTPGGVAFNLALASWYALSGLAAYGLLYNLLAARGKAVARGVGDLIGPLFAPLFLLVAGNLEGFLEMLHAGRVFWKTGADGAMVSSFWKWVDLQELTTPPALPFDWEPQRAGGIWWWRASRGLQDYTLNGQSREIIDEFPAFSYVLGDLHPHVLAMPFVLLAASLAFHIYLRLREGQAGHPSAVDGLRVTNWVRTPEFWLAALALGGLSFLNTWDFPIYLMLFAAAFTLARLVREGWNWGLAITFLEAAVPLLVAGVVLYLPFYLGFASQANGLMPSLVFFTRGIHFWIMFGALLLPVTAWLVWRVVGLYRAGANPALGQGLLVAGGLLGGLFLLSILYGLYKLGSEPGLAGIYGANEPGSLMTETLIRRLAQPGAWLSLLGLLALVWALVQAGLRRKGENGQVVEEHGTSAAPASQVDLPVGHSDLFVLLLILLGAGLVVFPEFFYLRDQFGWRMNTIFKFYYQAWVVWAIAAGYAAVVLLRETAQSRTGLVFPFALAGLLVMALVYPFFGFGKILQGFDSQAATLDGTAYLASYAPDDMAAIRWLRTAPYGFVAEAVGGSYTGYARVSTMSGLPAVLGWPGHESQWRGGEEEKGTREADMAQLYKARTWAQASAILEKYQIRYVFMGSLERSTYRPNESLFEQNLQAVFRSGSVTIYEVPRYNSFEEQAVQP